MKSKSTELIEAVIRNNDTVVEMLLRQGVNPNDPMPEEEYTVGANTAVMAAARAKNVAMLKLLVQYGLEIAGPKPIHAAIAPNYALGLSEDKQRVPTVETVKYLIQNGADLNAIDIRFQSTPFHTVIRNRDFELAQYFIENGALVNKADHTTPLLLAIEESSAQIVKLLLENGADTTQCVEGKKQPLEAALEAQANLRESDLKLKGYSAANKRMIDLLVKHGAKLSY